MYQGKSSFFKKNCQYLIPIILIILLVVIGIIFILSKKTQAIPASTNNDTSEVEVKNFDNSIDNTWQNGAATVEDLGGNKNSHQNIDELLKDKEIDVK